MVTPWPEEVPPAIPGWPETEPYSILQYRLDEARTEEEVNYPGDNITAATNGSLSGISIKFQSKRNKSVPLDQFNPISYPSGFEKFYLTNTAQAVGKKIYLFIGRAAGAAAPTVTFAASQTVKISGETVIAKVSGEVTRIYGYDYLSGEWRAPYVDASGEIKIAVTVADIVIAKISGDTVIAKISGDTVIAKISGDTVIAKVSGEVAKISGETVNIQSPTAVKTGVLLKPTSDSGGTIITSGAVKAATVKALSGDIYVGGSVAEDMPYSGHGFLLSQGEAWSLDIDNFGRIRVFPVISGAWVSYGGVA